MYDGRAVGKFAVAADAVVDTVIVIGKQLHLAVLHCIQLVVFIEAVLLHIRSEEGHLAV